VARLLAHNPALIDAVAFDDATTALHLAASEGHESTVAQLLSHSPGLIDSKATCNKTTLHIAASGGHVKVVAQLLALSPQSSDARDADGRTALHLAAANGHDEVVAQLLEGTCSMRGRWRLRVCTVVFLERSQMLVKLAPHWRTY